MNFSLQLKLKIIFTGIFRFSEGDVEGANGGLLTLGDYDKEHCSADCDWVDLTSATYYQFNVQNVQVGKSSTNDVVRRGRRSVGSSAAISDTGTSLIAGPTSTINSICTQLGGQYDSDNQVVRYKLMLYYLCGVIADTIYLLAVHRSMQSKRKPSRCCFYNQQQRLSSDIQELRCSCKRITSFYLIA